MKRLGILNRELSALVARLGHLDEITICDAGLPCPEGVPVLDLSLTLGKPTLWELLDTLRQELVIEGALWAQEAEGPVADRLAREIEAWQAVTPRAVSMSSIPHADLKARVPQSRAVLRSGDATPYANVILLCGVAF